MENNDTAVARERQAAELASLLPPVDVVEDATGITLFADLPGVPKDRLSVEVNGDTLTIEGAMDIRMPEGMEATHAEVTAPRYRRVFSLSKELDPGKLSAELKHGVLRLHIQKAEHARPRRITVQAG
jgi:HSP20 family molecular chaperone IbpA